jgi:hypothetical protein
MDFALRTMDVVLFGLGATLTALFGYWALVVLERVMPGAGANRTRLRDMASHVE